MPDPNINDPNTSESSPSPESAEPNSQGQAAEAADSTESFGELFSQYEQARKRKPEQSGKGLMGTVVAVTADAVLFDIGFKTEGILPLTAFESGEVEKIKPGDKLPVTNKGRDPEGYYQLARGRIERPKDWASLEKAFAEKSPILGTVTAVVKGGLSVDVGVRAFMPASRSGERDAAEMEKLVGQEIRCRIIKLDVADEDVVVDRRAVAAEEARAAVEKRYGEIAEGAIFSGVVRSLADYGAFVDIGGVDALLHVSDISWARVAKPADVLNVGQQVEVKVLKISGEAGKRRISVGMKQLQPQPWDSAAERYHAGERVRGVVTRVVEFGAFIELEPGVEGLIHLSEMSWSKKVRKPSDVVKPGDTVEAVVLGVNQGEHRMSLGLKQALGDPWAEVPHKFPVGSVVEGPVTSLQKFGAFVQVAEGVEGMIHVGDISAEKRINHPQDVLKMGQPVKAQVLEVDRERRRLKLGIKQMAPSSLDEYITEHKEGDVVTGRIVESSAGFARVELGEGVQASCRMTAKADAGEEKSSAASAGSAKADLSSLSSMLSARWKGGSAAAGTRKSEATQTGQVRSFRISKLDAPAKKIEVELA